MPDNKHTPDIKCYRINYNSEYWANVAAKVGNQCSSPVGAVFAVNALCDAYEDIAKQRDELLAAMEGLHKVCEIALSGKDGKQHTYFETRAGHLVEATEAMQAAESAIASVKGEQ